MRLSSRSEYGLRAMIDLACCTSSGPVSAREVSVRQSLPSKYLEQLFVALRRAGLVTAVRGARGGFVLSRPAADITVLDIVEALDGPLRPTVCDADSSTACAKGGACAASIVWEQATQAVREVLLATKLDELARIQADFERVNAGSNSSDG